MPFDQPHEGAHGEKGDDLRRAQPVANALGLHQPAIGRLPRRATVVNSRIRGAATATTVPTQIVPRRLRGSVIHAVAFDPRSPCRDAVAAVDDDAPLSQLLDRVSRSTTCHGRRLRAVRVDDPAAPALLQAISRGELATSRFRNRDLRYRPEGRAVRCSLSASLADGC